MAQLENDRTLRVRVARIASHDIAFEAAAHRTLIVVRAVALTHNQTGAFVSSIKMRSSTSARGVKDHIIYSTDPDALAIEYGHELVYENRDGELVRTGRYVPGIRVFNRAFDIMKATGSPA